MNVFLLDICDLLRSMEMLASRAAFVCGLLLKYWASPGGLSGRCGLSIWSEGGSSLIPLSLGDGDQRGEPDTESLPLSKALRKSSSACPGGCSICWAKTLKAIISLSVWDENTVRDGTVFKKQRPTEYTKDELYSGKKANNYLQHVWVTLEISQPHAHLGPGLARCDGCHGVLFLHDGEFHRFDQTASQAAQCHHIPEMRSWHLMMAHRTMSFLLSEAKTTRLWRFHILPQLGTVLLVTIHHNPRQTVLYNMFV